jgi:hypothetical protein
MNAIEPDRVPASHSAFWPLLIIGLATTAWGGFQTFHLGQEHEALKKLHANQESLVQNAGRLRAQLDGIAGDTQRLANTGNSNAQAIVAELRRRGITINEVAAHQHHLVAAHHLHGHVEDLYGDLPSGDMTSSRPAPLSGRARADARSPCECRNSFHWCCFRDSGDARA